MGDKSAIEWTHATWNPTTGCSKLTAGCKNCYAKREWERLKHNPQTVYFGREFEQLAVHPERLDQPIKWQRPRLIFVDSMSDLFHDQVPVEFIHQVLETMWKAPQHRFQLLTKRSKRMREVLAGRMLPDNLWLGVSAEDQLTWEDRVGDLLALNPSVRFVSAEPLLGSIDGRGRTSREMAVSVPPIPEWMLSRLQWVIVGGESGPLARAIDPRHVRWLRDQCTTAGVPFFFKQWGEWVPSHSGAMSTRVSEMIYGGRVPRSIEMGPIQSFRVGKKLAGRMLDGVEWSQFPQPWALAA